MEAPIFNYETERAWYCVHTRSRQEERVKSSLEARRESMGISDQLLQVVIPYETSQEIKNEKVVEVKKKLYPGYVFVEMNGLSDYAWYVIRNTNDVSGFIGSYGKGAKPTPVSDSDMLDVLSRSGERKVDSSEFTEGQSVKIITGPFSGTETTIKLIKDNTAIVPVIFANNETDIEIELANLLKVGE